MVIRETLVLAAFGLMIGVPVALWLSGFTQTFLYGMTPTDPYVLGAALLTMIGVSGVAGYLPARRAARIDPMVALRNE
jgi:ABC-type antimicrobial peptide transport system permease subunit